MTEEKRPTCPKCGSVMVPTHLDGTFKLDGSTDLSGYYCPNCEKSEDVHESKMIKLSLSHPGIC